MLKYSKVACAVALCVFVGVAAAAAVKIKTFDTSFGFEGPDADGMAILNYAQGQDKTIIQMVFSGMLPDTNYLFTLVSPSHCLQPGGGFITDENGHATFHGDLGAPPVFGSCTEPENGDWSDADIYLEVGANVHAVGWNPN